MPIVEQPASETSLFQAIVHGAQPLVAVVLGSGLAAAVDHVVPLAAIAFADIPGLVPPSVQGHAGRLMLGEWSGGPVLIFFGRLHFYEGHSWEQVTAPIRLASQLGIRTLILTNAAGGIHSSLMPGSLMAIRSHVSWLGNEAWRALADDKPRSTVYSARLVDTLVRCEREQGRELLAGTYAALTGPSYETPAEIRALARYADAVGMSTAKEAETGFALGMEVAAISCITNKAAGLGETGLDHREVMENAKLAVARLRELIGHLIHFA